MRKGTPSRRFSGIVLGWDDGAPRSPIGFTSRVEQKSARRKLVTDPSEAHALVVASTGSGKGRSIMIPTLLESEASAVVIDIKGEAAAVTAKRRREMGHRVVILDPFHIVTSTPDTFNPLDVVSRNPDLLDEDALEVAECLIGEGSHRDRYWDDNARSLISAGVAVVATRDDDEANLGSVWKMYHAEDTVYQLAVLLDTANVAEVPRGHIASFLQLPDRETRPCVLSSVHQHIRLFGNHVVKNAMRSTSFDLGALSRGEPVTIYLVIPPNKVKSHAPMLRVWLWAMLSIMTRRPTIPDAPTLFMIDEMAHLGAMPLLEECVALMRGYGVRMMLILQHPEQLLKLYPNSASTIVANCAAIAAFGIDNQAMAKPLADMFGDVSIEQLLAMPTDRLALRLRRQPTQVLSKVDYLTDARFRGAYEPNPRYMGRAVQRDSSNPGISR